MNQPISFPRPIWFACSLFGVAFFVSLCMPLHICVRLLLFFGIVLSANIKCCIGVDKYSWPTLVIATLTNAKLSHLSMLIMICGCTLECVCVRMTQFGRTCFALIFVYLIGRTKKKEQQTNTRTDTYSKHMNAL